MRIDEAISKSSEPLTIFIVKDALFCNVYEESAWRFSEFIKPYKPTRKRVKKLNMDVVSIGFPKSQLPALLQKANQLGFLIENEETGWLSVKLSREPEKPFLHWKEGIPLYSVEHLKAEPLQVGTPSVDYSLVIGEISSFSVADHTPMQTMLFLVDIQNKINIQNSPERGGIY